MCEHRQETKHFHRFVHLNLQMFYWKLSEYNFSESYHRQWYL